MAIKPVLHRIIVKPDDIMESDKTLKKAREMGLVIHRDEKDREQAAVDSGIVMSFGETVFRDYGVTENPLKVGDRVVFARYAGKAIMDNEVRYLALNDEDVVAIITEGA